MALCWWEGWLSDWDDPPSTDPRRHYRGGGGGGGVTTIIPIKDSQYTAEYHKVQMVELAFAVSGSAGSAVRFHAKGRSCPQSSA